MQKKKRLAIITGASSGIGKSFAYSLAEKGYDLALVARRKKLLDSIARDLKNKFETAVTTYEVDLSVEDKRKKLITLFLRKYPSIDLLINNAGFGNFGESSNIGVEQSLNMIKVNIMAVTDLSLSLIPMLLKSKQKSIINVASVAAFHPSIYGGVYAATKAYVYNFSMALAAEYDGRLNVLTLCPGITDTGFWQAARVGTPRFLLRSSEEVVEKALASLGKKKLLIIGYENHARIFIQRFIPDIYALTLTKKIQVLLTKKNK
jgi:short-subunit dehydrogenase